MRTVNGVTQAPGSSTSTLHRRVQYMRFLLDTSIEVLEKRKQFLLDSADGTTSTGAGGDNATSAAVNQNSAQSALQGVQKDHHPLRAGVLGYSDSSNSLNALRGHGGGVSGTGGLYSSFGSQYNSNMYQNTHNAAAVQEILESSESVSFSLRINALYTLLSFLNRQSMGCHHQLEHEILTTQLAAAATSAACVGPQQGPMLDKKSSVDSSLGYSEGGPGSKENQNLGSGNKPSGSGGFSHGGAGVVHHGPPGSGGATPRNFNDPPSYGGSAFNWSTGPTVAEIRAALSGCGPPPGKNGEIFQQTSLWSRHTADSFYHVIIQPVETFFCYVLTQACTKTRKGKRRGGGWGKYLSLSGVGKLLGSNVFSSEMSRQVLEPDCTYSSPGNAFSPMVC